MNIIEIVQLKADGLCVKEIAVRMNANVRTIEKIIERKKKEFYMNPLLLKEPIVSSKCANDKYKHAV